MYYETPQNPSYIVQPANQPFTAIPVYSPSQSSTRHIIHTNNDQRVMQASPFLRTPINSNVTQYYVPSNSNSSSIVTPRGDQQQQPILVMNNHHQNYVNPSIKTINNKPMELEKVRVIGNNEREFFKDGTSVYRSYKYCTCCRARFVKLCPTWNYMVWFYSFPCWVWFLTILLFLAFLGALIFLITQLPTIKTYYTYSYKAQTIDDYKIIITPAGCLTAGCYTVSSSNTAWGNLVNFACGRLSSSNLYLLATTMTAFVFYFG